MNKEIRERCRPQTEVARVGGTSTYSDLADFLGGTNQSASKTTSDLAQIMREGEELRDGCGKKRAIHVANRCSNELRRASALRHSRHEQRYAASLRPSICRAQETHN